jgi:PIN domain nuclease of toxin-antitoxin system
VKGYLLDTNVALLATMRSITLSEAIRGALATGPTHMSVVSYWEVVLKSMKGNLDVGDPQTWLVITLEQLGATSLSLRPDHITEICNLPPIHQDPFDRALIAQAIAEDLTLLTTDSQIPRYAGPRLSVIS